MEGIPGMLILSASTSTSCWWNANKLIMVENIIPKIFFSSSSISSFCVSVIICNYSSLKDLSSMNPSNYLALFFCILFLLAKGADTEFQILCQVHWAYSDQTGKFEWHSTVSFIHVSFLDFHIDILQNEIRTKERWHPRTCITTG